MFPEGARALIGRLSPMAVYTISPFIGPVVGPLVGGYVPLGHSHVHAVLIRVSHRFVVQVRTAPRTTTAPVLIFVTEHRLAVVLPLAPHLAVRADSFAVYSESSVLRTYCGPNMPFQCVPETYVPVILKRKARKYVYRPCDLGAVLTFLLGCGSRLAMKSTTHRLNSRSTAYYIWSCSAASRPLVSVHQRCSLSLIPRVLMDVSRANRI